MNKTIKTVAIDGRMWGAGFTGIGNYVREISQRLFLLEPNKTFVLFVSSQQAKIISVPANVKIVIADEPIYSIAEQTSFRKKLLQEKGDMTWFPHFNVPLFFNRPFVATIHDLTIITYPGKKMSRFWHKIAYSLVLRHALKKAKKIITVSQYTKKEVLAYQKMNPEHIFSIWNGVDQGRYSNPSMEKIQHFRKEFSLPFFLITGVWREHKNIPNAIRAFDLYRKHGGKGSLVITGRPDPFYPEVRDLAESSDFSRDIHLTGFLPEDDMPSLFSAADVLLFPSLAEGFGLPAVEAMAAGTPVITSNRSCLPEICSNAALYFDPFQPEDIALKMIDALEEKIISKIVPEGKKRSKIFSWDTAAKKTAGALFSSS